MGGSWGQELPFPRGTPDNGVSPEQGQKRPSSAADDPAAVGARGAASAPSRDKAPVGPSRGPVDGGSGTATAAGAGDPAFARTACAGRAGWGL